MAKLDNIQSLLESSIPTDVFFAYSLILEEEFAKQLTKLHGNELCGSAHFRTIRQLFDFMVVKHQQYCTSDEEKALMEKHVTFYAKEALLFITFAKNHI